MSVECPWPGGPHRVECFPCGVRYIDIESDKQILTFVPSNLLFSRLMYFWGMSDAEKLGLSIEIDGELAKDLIKMVILHEREKKVLTREVIRKWFGEGLNETNAEKLGKVLAVSFSIHKPHHYPQLEACLKCPLADWDKLAKKVNAKIRKRFGL